MGQLYSRYGDSNVMFHITVNTLQTLFKHLQRCSSFNELNGEQMI